MLNENKKTMTEKTKDLITYTVSAMVIGFMVHWAFTPKVDTGKYPKSVYTIKGKVEVDSTGQLRNTIISVEPDTIWIEF